nr:C40 family peptidase [Simplicispira psychrophila]
MSQWFCTLLLVFASAAHAAPPNDTNEVTDRWMMNTHEVIDRWMEDKNVMTSSVMTQIDAVRHDVADKTSGLVVTAMGLLGVPYRRGGTSAETGFDCSGFVRAIYSQTIGLVLPRRANEQAAATQTIDKKELQPGDLVFFNTMRRTFSHVGIYIGDGKFVHSPRTGETVRVEDMQAAYWKKRFNGARRVVDYSLTTQAQ